MRKYVLIWKYNHLSGEKAVKCCGWGWRWGCRGICNWSELLPNHKNDVQSRVLTPHRMPEFIYHYRDWLREPIHENEVMKICTWGWKLLWWKLLQWKQYIIKELCERTCECNGLRYRMRTGLQAGQIIPTAARFNVTLIAWLRDQTELVTNMSHVFAHVRHVFIEFDVNTNLPFCTAKPFQLLGIWTNLPICEAAFRSRGE